MQSPIVPFERIAFSEWVATVYVRGEPRNASSILLLIGFGIVIAT
jgi:hypothetical protein